MLRFTEFLKEETQEVDVLTVDARYLENNLASLNNDLENLTAKPYQKATIFLNQLNGTLQRYGMILPPTASPNFFGASAELVYGLGDTPYFLYIVFNTNDDTFIDGYAQVVTSDELQDLVNMDKAEMFNRAPMALRPTTWYAKKDDDSGNTSEY